MSEHCDHHCESCGENCPSRTEPQNFQAKPHESSNIKNVIAVVSGKGGVGKSLITSLLAVQLNLKGCNTAILDADITGPSIPKTFGIHHRATGSEEGIIPIKSKSGISIMSVNLLLENETDPVVWRGPILAGTVKQFWSDVIWNDVDFMLVDMPPGTGDVPLTVFQSLPVKGIIVVTSPQELVFMIVEKAVKMARMMNIPILGLVENMSWFECPECHTRHYIYGKSSVEDVAAKFSIPQVVRLPVNPEMAKNCDSGKIEDLDDNNLESMADFLIKHLT